MGVKSFYLAGYDPSTAVEVDLSELSQLSDLQGALAGQYAIVKSEGTASVKSTPRSVF